MIIRLDASPKDEGIALLSLLLLASKIVRDFKSPISDEIDPVKQLVWIFSVSNLEMEEMAEGMDEDNILKLKSNTTNFRRNSSDGEIAP